MAGPGLLAPWNYAGPGAPIGEHDSSTTPAFAIGDWENYLWFTFTPEHSGVVSIDLYLTTAAGGTSQAGVEAYSDNLYQDLPGWQYISQEYGGPEEDLARYIGVVQAGVPVTFNAYGYTADDLPVDLVVRVSDVIDPGDAPWEEGPPLTVHYQDQDSFGVARIGVIDGTSQVQRTSYPAPGVRRTTLRGEAFVNNGGGAVDRALVESALRTARRGFNVSGTNPPMPVTQAVATPEVNLSLTGWTAHQRPAAAGFTGDVDVQASYSALALAPYDMAEWVAGSVPEIGWPPAPPDEGHVIQPGGLAGGVTVKAIEFAPDAFLLNADMTADIGPTTWAIYQAKTRTEDPARWGPSGRSDDEAADALATQAGPESLLTDPAAQVLTWTPTTTPTPFTPVSGPLFTAALDRAEQYRETLLILGGAASTFTDVPPAFPFPIPDDGNQDTSRNTLTREYTGVGMHLRVTFARVYRPVVKPPLWEVTGYRPTRLYPREDGAGLSAAPRLHPPQRRGRVIGGFR